MEIMLMSLAAELFKHLILTYKSKPVSIYDLFRRKRSLQPRRVVEILHWLPGGGGGGTSVTFIRVRADLVLKPNPV